MFLIKRFTSHLPISEKRYYLSKKLKSRDKLQKVTTTYIEARKYLERPAISDIYGIHSYKTLLVKAKIIADEIKECFKKNELISEGPRGATKDETVHPHQISLLSSNDSSYVIGLWAIWLSKCVAVPASEKYPLKMLNYILNDARVKLLICDSKNERFAQSIQILNKDLLILTMKEDFIADTREESIDQIDDDNIDMNIFPCQSALIVYTSGTTGNPKGVVHTHASLHSQIRGMEDSWGWTSNDVVLHMLPLHHVHGIVNALLTPLHCGALCIMKKKFEPNQVWDLILHNSGEIIDKRRVNIFMGVPTMYAKLLDYLQENYTKKIALDLQNSEEKISIETSTKDFMNKSRQNIKNTCMKNIRLFVSGSAPLSINLMERWEEETGHMILERYGMTETGMVLTNSLTGPRIKGSVGLPFPNVQVAIGRKIVLEEGVSRPENTEDNKVSNQIVSISNHSDLDEYQILVKSDSTSSIIFSGKDREDGELLVKGSNLFKEYLYNLSATKQSFTKDGWFITGDTVTYHSGSYFILGRTSIDMIKSGGFKISALEIEQKLLNHPLIKEVAVFGLDDLMWGQKVVAAVVLRKKDDINSKLNMTETDYDVSNLEVCENIKEWSANEMAPYQAPSQIKVVDNLQRNAMGKVNKKHLCKLLFNL